MASRAFFAFNSSFLLFHPSRATPLSLMPKRETIRLIVDTREKRPWVFSPIVTTRRAKLESGDYSIEGFEDRVAVERKTKDDFVSSICSGRSRFNRELRRLQAFEFAAVIVEAELPDLLSGNYTSGMSARAVLATTAAITVERGIPVFFASHRAAAAILAEAFFARFITKNERTKGRANATAETKTRTARKEDRPG